MNLAFNANYEFEINYCLQQKCCLHILLTYLFTITITCKYMQSTLRVWHNWTKFEGISSAHYHRNIYNSLLTLKQCLILKPTADDMAIYHTRLMFSSTHTTYQMATVWAKITHSGSPVAPSPSHWIRQWFSETCS